MQEDSRSALFQSTDSIIQASFGWRKFTWIRATTINPPLQQFRLKKYREILIWELHEKVDPPLKQFRWKMWIKLRCEKGQRSGGYKTRSSSSSKTLKCSKCRKIAEVLYPLDKSSFTNIECLAPHDFVWLNEVNANLARFPKNSCILLMQTCSSLYAPISTQCSPKTKYEYKM